MAVKPRLPPTWVSLKGQVPWFTVLRHSRSLSPTHQAWKNVSALHRGLWEGHWRTSRD